MAQKLTMILLLTGCTILLAWAVSFVPELRWLSYLVFCAGAMGLGFIVAIAVGLVAVILLAIPLFLIVQVVRFAWEFGDKASDSL